MMDSQGADFYFEPRGDRRSGPLFRQLDEMTDEPCTLEFWSRVPTTSEFCRGPLRKHAELFQWRFLEAGRRREPEPSIQAQWLLLPAHPALLLKELPCSPEPGWAPGTCYRFTTALRVRLVVLSALARTRETLLLRLLGPLPLRRQALAEVSQIPAGDPEGPALVAMLACVRYMIEKDPRIPQPDKEEFMNAIRQEFEKFKEGLIQQGLEKGQAQMLLRVLRARGLRVTEEQQQRILSCANPLLLARWGDRAVLAQTTEEVFSE